ncbi:MAG: DUF262 domain-containing protein [Methylacidiphilales bacterium]|nr:DUF262 domain-containing protein [Candidatus Methylacidiphilales bacterium]
MDIESKICAEVGATDFASLFKENRTVEIIKVRDLIDWHLSKTEGRLLLPPIQRSLVWRNEQIVNYWDSLLRGYPAGMIMVHRRPKVDDDQPKPQGRDSAGHTRMTRPDDWMLFDGQQRLASLLLGFGEGPWSMSLRLWVDFGVSPDSESGLKYQLRISSAGQPFGYQAKWPGSKFPIEKRREKIDEWTTPGKNKPTIKNVNGSDIIDQIAAVPLEDICKAVLIGGKALSSTSSFAAANSIEAKTAADFSADLRDLFNSEFVVKLIDERIVNNSREYIRLFGRIGQGGARLTDDEFTYSILKQNYPSIHDRMREIMVGKEAPGRIADEVNLVLGSLRVAKVIAPRENVAIWEIASRPDPEFVSSKLMDWPQARKEFLALIPPVPRDGCPDESQGGKLLKSLKALRLALSYDEQSAPDGFPSILFARFPKELVEVLLLFAAKGDGYLHWTGVDMAALRSFALHWLLFVINPHKAANAVFAAAASPKWIFSSRIAKRLIYEFERQGFARPMAREDALVALRAGVADPAGSGGALRVWEKRFSEDRESRDTLRCLASNGESIKCALMWLQRSYLEGNFGDYDPTSDRDDDLPVDLDHLIPRAVFSFDWRHADKRLEDDIDLDNFRNHRGVVGNSLGNYRWLSASENRERRCGLIVPDVPDTGLIGDVAEWNALIPRDGENRIWSPEDVSMFQRLIDMRTLRIYEALFQAIKPILPDTQEWSEDLKRATRNSIEGQAFIPRGDAVAFKHVASGFATMTITDLLAGNLKLVDCDSGEETTFANVDELIRAGWAID